VAGDRTRARPALVAARITPPPPGDHHNAGLDRATVNGRLAPDHVKRPARKTQVNRRLARSLPSRMVAGSTPAKARAATRRSQNLRGGSDGGARWCPKTRPMRALAVGKPAARRPRPALRSLADAVRRGAEPSTRARTGPRRAGAGGRDRRHRTVDLPQYVALRAIGDPDLLLPDRSGRRAAGPTALGLPDDARRAGPTRAQKLGALALGTRRSALWRHA